MRFLNGPGWMPCIWPECFRSPKEQFSKGSPLPTKRKNWRPFHIAFLLFTLSFSAFAQNRAEYFFDTDPGIGNGTSLPVLTGDSVTINRSISISSLSTGFHTLFVRTQMANRWSLTESRPFFITSATSATASPVSEMEYFFDTDPGIGLGTRLSISPSADSVTRTAAIPISSLSTGFHTLYIRAKNNRGYSLTESRTFFIVTPSSANAGPISSLEYFFDSDPGIGNGTRLAISPAADSSTRTAVIPISSLTAGFHTIYVRARNNTGYSLTESRTFFIVAPSSGNAGPITSLEYFFDTDPGIGNGVSLSINPAADSASRTAVIPISSLAQGFHTLYIRGKNNTGFSQTESRTFFIMPVSSAISGPVARMEYFIDTDPGFGNGTAITGFTSSDSVSLTRTLVLPTNISTGPHKLYVRTQGTDKKWSITEVEDFEVACGETEITSTQTQVCPGLATILSFTGGNLPGSYQWIRNGQAITGATAFNFTANQPGNYQLRYSNGNCTDTSDVLTIGTGTTTLATISPNTPQQLCANQSVTFQGNTGSGLTYVWLRNGTVWTNGGSSLTTSSTGNYSLAITNTTGCKDTSDVVAVTATTGPGDPSLFGNNLWNLFVWNTSDISLANPANYLGTYTVNALNYDTRSDWGENSNPSAFSGYTGCAMGNDQFTIAMKRRGFPAGQYTLNITGHDDAVQVLLNGTQVYNVGCCSQNGVITLGTLGANSTLEIRCNEGIGQAFLAFTLTSTLLNPGAIAGEQTVCTGQLPSQFTSVSPASGGSTPNIRYQWQDSTDGGLWQNLPNATALTLQIQNSPSDDNWFRRLAINGTDTASSNVIKLSIQAPTGNPSVFPQDEWNANCYFGSNIDLTGTVYAGRYKINSLNFNTVNDWAANATPSDASSYLGCAVPVDNFTIVFKRKGFPTGSYTLNIPSHDDYVRVLVNGVKVFEHLSCCDAHTDIPIGALNSNSEVEVRLIEFFGDARLELQFVPSQFEGGEIAASQTICASVQPAAFTSIAPASGGGAGNITYQWQDSTSGGSWQNITNATSETYASGLLSSTRWFRRRATAGANLVAFSNELQITVLPTPNISVSPAGPITVCEGELVSLSVSGAGNASLKWLRNNVQINGQISSQLFVSQSSSYRAVATAANCTDTSNSVLVQVNPRPSPVVSPVGPITLCNGLSSTITLTNPQTGQTVQWKDGGSPIPGGNSISVSSSGFYYPVVTITATGCKDSTAGVSVNFINPSVNPVGPVQLCQGGSTNLTVSSTGGANIQWLRNENPISGATNPTFAANQTGTYKAIGIVAGVCADTSNGVLVNVNALPNAQITSVVDSFCAGGSLVLRANQGTGLSYQWKRNGSNIANATADTLLVNIAGSYTVEVRNAANCSQTSAPRTIRSVSNLTWFLDVDGDNYSAGLTVSSCSRPQNGFLAGELQGTNNDCNDLDATINPSRQFFQYVGTGDYANSLVSPQQGTPYTNFRFEAVYFDLNNNPAPPTFPRIILDFEGNGQLNNPNDRTIIMQEFDSRDNSTSDGKRYFCTVNSLPSGLNYTTRVVSNVGSCGTTFGPFNYPDVFILADLQIFANDITFDNTNPPLSSPLQISAKIYNVSDFAAQNFVVHLVNQFDTTIVYPDILVPFLAPQTSTTVTWNITTPAVPAWCPMQVFVDWTKVIQETNELDNSAIRPFVNGNFNVPGAITVNPSVVPSTVVGVPGASASLSGTAVYTGTAVPLQNPSVAGAQVTFTVQPGGQSYTTYTNSSGQINFSFLVGLTPGVYTVTGTITDFTLTTNFTTTFTVIPPVCLPDLVANLNVSSINIVEGESLTGTIRIRNQGCQPVNDTTLLKFTQSGGSPTLVNVKIPPLAINEFVDVPLPSLTFNTPGVFSICGQADGNFQIAEASEGNNQSCALITVIPFLPDLYPTNCGLGGQQFITGQPSNIGVSLYNSGGSATGPFTTRVILFRDGTPVDTIDQAIANVGRQSGTSFNFQYTYPAPGTYSISVYVDSPAPNGVVTETNETNNASNCSVLILATRPDLAFIGGCDDLKVNPTDPAFPGNITFRARVGNTGNATATAPILVRFTLSGGTVVEETLTTDLPAGQSVLISKTIPSVAPATQTISGLIDPNNTVGEFIESNNATGPRNLCHESAPVDNICGGNWWSNTYLINQAIFLNVPVQVSGAYKISQLKVRFFVSGPGLAGTINLGDAILDNLEDNCTCPRTATLPVNFAFPQEGEYTFTFVTDPDNQYTECNESNNTLVRRVKVSGLPDMRVLSQLINPTKLNPDLNEFITIQGTYENIGLSNIDQTMKFKLLVDEIAIDSATVNGLVTGDNFTVNFTKPWSSDIVGAHIIRTIIDAENVIQESNKANNEATRAVIVGAAANMYFQVFQPSVSSPTLGQQITVNVRVGNNGDEDVEGLVQLFYINNQGDTIQIGQAPIAVEANDSTILNFPWTVADNNTTLIGKIVNSNIMEFNYDDNMATAPLGLFNVSLSSTPACAGKPNGSLFVVITGGTSPFTYLWSTGFTGDSLVSGPGIYTLSVTDANSINVLVSGSIPNIPGVRYFRDADGDTYGNPAIDSVDCVQPQGYVRNNLDCNDANPNQYKTTPVPNILVDGSLTFCTGSSVRLRVVATPRTTYTWSNGVVNDTLEVSISDTFSVSAQLDSGCVAVSQSVITEALTSLVPTASVSLNTDTLICTGTPVTFSAQTTGGGIQPLEEWYLNDVFVQVGPNYQTDTLKDGDEVQYILTSAESCANPVVVLSDKIRMTVRNGIQANAGADQTICNTIASLSGNLSGTWIQISGSGTIQNPNSANTQVTGLGIGENEFVWTTSGGTCPSTSDTISITVLPPPSNANAGTDQTLCADSALVQAVIPQIGTGTWTLLSGSGNIAGPNSAGTTIRNLGLGVNQFIWTVSNGNCPSNSDTLSITRIDGNLVADAGLDQTISSDATALTGHSLSSGQVGKWKLVSGAGLIEDTLSPTTNVTGLGLGENVFSWTVSNFCGTISDSVSIFRNQVVLTQANAGPDQNICADSTNLAGNTPQVGIGEWILISGSGNFLDPSIANSPVSGLGTGLNQFAWTISLPGIGENSDTVDVFVNASPSLANAGTDQTLCADSALVQAVIPQIGTGTWTLLSGSGNIAGPNSAGTTIRNLGLGVNQFIWTVSNANCPSNSDTLTLTQQSPPSTALAGSDQTTCDSNAVAAGNNPTIGTGTWTLISGAGTIVNASDPATLVRNLGIGTNTLVWTISNGICPESKDTVQITRQAAPGIALAGDDQQVCGNQTTLAGNLPAIGTGTWTILSGTGNLSDPQSPTASLSGLSQGLVRLVWSISNGICPVSRDTLDIEISLPPSQANAGQNQSVCVDSVQLAALAPQVGQGFWKRISGNGQFEDSLLATTKVRNLGIGSNLFVWTVQNGFCPESADTVTIVRLQGVTQANAGTDQAVCGPNATLAANAPFSGSGTWILVSGGGNLANALDPTTAISNLNPGLNLLVWSISNGVCPSSTDTVFVVSSPPLVAEAGLSQVVCGDSTTLAASIPVAGLGRWEVVSGTGTFAEPDSANSKVSGLSLGSNTLRWIVFNNVCPSDTDLVNITVFGPPSPAQAGQSQNICGTSASLSATVPIIGVGSWALVSGSGTLSDTSIANPTVSGLGIGANTFRWTVRNGVCPPSFDLVTLTGNPIPLANAGEDNQVCASSADLEAIAAQGVSGNWVLLSGSGTIANPQSDTTTVSGLAIGANRFEWTAVLGSCSAKDTVVLSRQANPVFLGNDTTICFDSTLVLNAGPGHAAYLWSDGTTGQTFTVDTAGIYWVEIQTVQNCLFRDSIVVDTTICTSTKGLLAKNGIRWNVYPNPNKGQFLISLEGITAGKADIRVYNQIGVLVYEARLLGSSSKWTSELQLPTEIPNGMYQIQIRTEGQVLKEKVVIVR